MTHWEFKGRELVNCSCEYGCNCQFNALPDKGHCHAVAGIQIDEGHHGDGSNRVPATDQPCAPRGWSWRPVAIRCAGPGPDRRPVV